MISVPSSHQPPTADRKPGEPDPRDAAHDPVEGLAPARRSLCGADAEPSAADRPRATATPAGHVTACVV
jgi:hypothetical protein